MSYSAMAAIDPKVVSKLHKAITDFYPQWTEAQTRQ
jgi:hypothetical protein